MEGNFAKFLFKCTRLELSELVQFITGHGFVKYHLFNTGCTDDKSCHKCRGDTEFSWHLLAECPALARHRLDTMYTTRIQPWNIQPPCLKTFVISKPIQALMGFSDEAVASQMASAEATK